MNKTKNIKILHYKSIESFYNSPPWRKLRKEKINKNPLCEHCIKENKITPAEEVDHILTIINRPDLALHYNNLQSLCKKCHIKKTTEDNKGKQRERKKTFVKTKWKV